MDCMAFDEMMNEFAHSSDGEGKRKETSEDVGLDTEDYGFYRK